MDKSLLKISGVIAFVLGIICCCTIVGAIVGVPMIIGGVKLQNMSNMSDDELRKNKEALLVWTIVFLVICQLSGILALIFYIQFDNPNGISLKANQTNESRYNDLEKLNQLYKDKELTKEEFEAEKERILKRK